MCIVRYRFRALSADLWHSSIAVFYAHVSEKFFSAFLHFSFAFFLIISSILYINPEILHKRTAPCCVCKGGYTQSASLFRRSLWTRFWVPCTDRSPRPDNFVSASHTSSETSSSQVIHRKLRSGLFALRSKAIKHRGYCVLQSNASLYTTLLLRFIHNISMSSWTFSQYWFSQY